MGPARSSSFLPVSVLRRMLDDASAACLMTISVHLQIDTARKLRWYDREDLSQLISISTREKQQLQDTITALRQVTCGLLPSASLHVLHFIEQSMCMAWV